jgi:predicted ferric reductase
MGKPFETCAIQRSRVHLLFFFAILSVRLSTAAAWRHYLHHIPNSNLIPCPDPDVAGCLGGYCEAVGHDGCSAQGEVNDFGNKVDSHPSAELHDDAASTRQGQWSIGTCAADSDADGYSNGDETGDYCCAWNGHADSLMKLTYNEQPVALSNPAWDLSKPIIPSCSYSGPPGAPVDPTAAAIAPTYARLAWKAPASCVCEYQVQLYSYNTDASVFTQVRGDVLEVAVCNLEPLSSYDFHVIALNRAGRSDQMEQPVIVTFTTLDGVAGRIPNDCAGHFPSDLNLTYTMYMNTIPAGGYVNQHTLPYQAPWSLAWVIVPTLVLLVLSILLNALGKCRVCRQPHDLIFHFLVAGMCCKRGWHTAEGKARLRDCAQSSRIFSVAVAAAAVFIAGMWVHSSLWYADYMRYSPAQVAGSVWRGSGYALAACMGLQILPVTRWSPWMKLVGLSFERGLTLHRWVSAGSMILTAVHGIGIAVEYGNSPLKVDYLFRWNDGDLPVNPLAGTLAGFAMIVLGVTALAPVRRWCYELFLLGHALYPAIFALSILHTRMSESAAMPLLLPGIILLAFDHLIAFLDCCLRPTQVLSASIVGAEGRRVVKLECQKNGLLAVIESIWPFHYEAGHYVYAIVPAISLMPHPFSISSIPDATRKDLFTLHIREMGGNSYTSQLAKIVAGAASYADLDRPIKSLVTVAIASADGPDRTSVPTQSPSAPQLDDPTDQENDQSNSGQETPEICGELDPSVPDLLSFREVLNSGISMWVSGPFGIPTLPLNAYDHFVLIAGGIGITPIASLHEQIMAAQQRPPVDPSVASTSEKTLITAWAVREAELATEFMTQLASKPGTPAEGAELPRRIHCASLLFGSLPNSIEAAVDHTCANFEAATQQGLAGETFAVNERLSAGKLVDYVVERVRRLRETNAQVDPKIAIVVCGAQSLVDDAYAAAAKYPQAGSGVIVHIHKELFAF